MSYRFERNETISDGVRRIANEQLQAALDGLEAPSRDEVAGVVHDVRKRCKKLRGLIRLVRPAMGSRYRPVNATIRDAARELSSIRDAHALLATFDDLLSASAAPVSTPALQAVRDGLVARDAAATDAVTDADERVQRARALLRLAYDDVANWPLSDDVADVVAGLSKTYNRGRNRLADCIADPTDGNLHEWRKRAKYSWYHVRLLQDSAPSVLGPLADSFHDLSDAIGSDHDLAVLTEMFRSTPDEFGAAEAVREAQLLIDGQRADLQRRAVRLGARLYVETPEAFGARMAGYHHAWMTHGPELDTGAIATLAPSDEPHTEENAEPEAAVPAAGDAAPEVGDAAQTETSGRPDDVPGQPGEQQPVDEVAAVTADGVIPADGAAADPATRGDGHAPDAGQLDQMPRAEVYRLAQQLDIAGRSRMTRAQLVAAVRAAGAPGNA